MKNEEPIVVEQVFDTSVEKVWNAITVLDEMKQWFFDNVESFEPVVGFETRFDIQVANRVYPHLWKLIEVVTYKKITYDWRYAGYAGKSIVEFEIIAMVSQTKLRLTSSVIECFPENIAEFTRESGVEGWTYFIQKSLKNYLESA